MNKKLPIFLLILFVGLIIRLFIISISPKEIYWDEGSYNGVASAVLKGGFAIDCCQKGPGFPLILAGMNLIFGERNKLAASFFNLVLDIGSGILIYILAKKFFGEKVGVLASFLFAINPFTNAYLAFILPENFTMLLLLIIFTLITCACFKKYPYIWFIVGFLIAYLLTTRLSLQGYIYLLIFYLVIYGIKIRKKIGSVLLILGFLVGSSYILVGNFIVYDKISLVPPFQISIPATMYEMRSLGKNPEQLPIIERLDSHYRDINLEYNTTYWKDVPLKNEKYNNLFRKDFTSNPFLYIQNYINNIFWMWDKNYIIVFEDPFLSVTQIILPILNILLIASSMMGFAVWVKQGVKNEEKRIFLFAYGTLFLYITFIFALVSNETRHTIIFYPLLIILSAYGLTYFSTQILSKIHIHARFKNKKSQGN